MTLSVRIDCNVRWTDTYELNAMQTPKDNFLLAIKQLFADGVDIDEATTVYSASLDVTGVETFDLFGSLVDWKGDTINAVNVKAIIIKNDADEADTGYVLDVGAGSDPLPIFDDVSDAITLVPQGIFLLTDPSAAGIIVTDAASDTITLDAGANTVPVRLAIVMSS